MHVSAVQPPVHSGAPSPGGYPAGKGPRPGASSLKHVLVVDDNAMIRQLLRLALIRHFEVSEAEDGAQALDLARSQKPDAVLLDVMMPGELDGLAVLARLKSDPALGATFVAMVTARSQAADKEAAMALGADAYFVKPFSPLDLARALLCKLA